MADEVKHKDTVRHVSEDERFKFIGFEVYPGKPKDLFASEAEKAKYVEAIQEKRKRGDVLREDCTLFEERVSWLDRIVLTVASAAIVIALFFPWFSVYHEVQTSTPATEAVEAAPAPTPAPVVPAPAEPAAAQPAATEPGAAAEPAASAPITPSEEVIHGYVARRTVERDYTTLSGLGALISLGGIASVTFSSGLALMLTSLLGIAYILLCLALPAYTVYGLWMLKGTADERALRLKKILRMNWLLLIIFGANLFLSFFGGDYGSAVVQQYDSLGTSYSVGVFIGTLSWGIFVTLAASILVAAKGSEI